ncbi:MAG: ADP-ribosylglycohydrolase family protein, partial [Candidatus Methylomirabilales bacterium]
LKAMQVGLWVLQQGHDFETVLVEVVNTGGDTDTNGAVAGAVMGARVGLQGIPPRWQENIRDKDTLVDLADRLFDASEGRASRSGEGPSVTPETPSEQEGGRKFDIADLKRRGFQGFKAVRELEDNAKGVATRPGVYVVVRADDSPPRFLIRNSAGRFRGDPTERVGVLRDKWVPNIHTLYIGCTKRTLRVRIGELVRFSRGQNVGHRGGRYLWQVEGNCDFEVAWLEDENPRVKERELLAEFQRCLGRLPFANLPPGKQNA